MSICALASDLDQRIQPGADRRTLAKTHLLKLHCSSWGARTRALASGKPSQGVINVCSSPYDPLASPPPLLKLPLSGLAPPLFISDRLRHSLYSVLLLTLGLLCRHLVVSHVLPAHEGHLAYCETETSRADTRRLIAIKTIWPHVHGDEVRVQALHRPPVVVVSVDEAGQDAVAAALDIGVISLLVRLQDVLVEKLVLALPRSRQLRCLGWVTNAAASATSSNLERLALCAQLRRHTSSRVRGPSAVEA